MRHLRKALLAASVVMLGVAHAAPAFGGSGMRLGGENVDRAKERPSISDVVKSVRKAMVFRTSAKAAPVSDDELSETRTVQKTKCDREEKTEVARADTKDEETANGGKKKMRGGEPIYLAF